MSYTKGGTAGGWIHVSHGKTPIALVHPKYVDEFIAAPKMFEQLKATRDWLALMEANIPLHGKLLKDINEALAEADGGKL